VIEANAARFLAPDSSRSSRTSLVSVAMNEGVPGLVSVIVALNPHDHAMGPVLDAWGRPAAAGPFEVIVVDSGARRTCARTLPRTSCGGRRRR
jgi:hypothetical protein